MSDPVTYTAVLPVAEETVHFVSGLLAIERRRRGTRGRRRALGCYRQAVLVLRWFLDGTRLAQLAADHRIGRSTAYRYLHEGIDVLAAAAPGLRGALLAARAAGHSHVTVDGTLIRTDRCHVPGPTARTDRSGRQVDLWWSGKHAAHGGNVQVILSEQLETALHSRILIEQAKGVLSTRAETSVEEAFRLMRTHARRTGSPLTTVADGVVSGSIGIGQMLPAAGPNG